MKRNQQELMDIMYYHKLKADDVAKIVGVSIKTVYIWRCKSSVSMTDEHLQTLKNFVAEDKS